MFVVEMLLESLQELAIQVLQDFLIRLLLRIGGFDGAAEAAAGGELANDGGGNGFTGFDDIGQNFVDGVFVEDAEVSISMHIDLERFEFEAGLIGDVGEVDGSKIG